MIRHHNKTGREQHAIPWIFVWRDPPVVKRDPMFEDWRTGAELLEGMKAIGVNHALDAAVGDLLTRGVDFKCHRPPLGGKAMAVVIGVRLPHPS